MKLPKKKEISQKFCHVSQSKEKNRFFGKQNQTKNQRKLPDNNNNGYPIIEKKFVFVFFDSGFGCYVTKKKKKKKKKIKSTGSMSF